LKYEFLKRGRGKEREGERASGPLLGKNEMKEETDLCEKQKDRQWVKQQSAYHLLVEKLLKEHLLLFIIHRRCSCFAEFIIYVNVVLVVHLFFESSSSLLLCLNQRRKKNN